MSYHKIRYVNGITQNQALTRTHMVVPLSMQYLMRRGASGRVEGANMLFWKNSGTSTGSIFFFPLSGRQLQVAMTWMLQKFSNCIGDSNAHRMLRDMASPEAAAGGSMIFETNRETNMLLMVPTPYCFGNSVKWGKLLTFD